MEKKKLVKYFYEVIVSNNLLDELSQYISEDCVLKVGEKMVPLGLDGMRQHLAEVKKTYPDYTMNISIQMAIMLSLNLLCRGLIRERLLVSNQRIRNSLLQGLILIK